MLIKEEVTFTESAKVDHIKEFFNTFKNRDEYYKYLDKIDSLTGSNILISLYDLMDYEHEKKLDFKIWTYFVNNASESIRLTKRAVREVYNQSHDTPLHDIQILIDKSDYEINVNQAIKHKPINKLVSMNCRIHGESTIQHKIVKGIWLCPQGHKTKTESNSTPIVCDDSSCKSRSFVLDEVKSEIESFRSFYVKDLEFNDHSDSLIVEVTGDLIDSVKMGEIVKFTGYVTLEQKNKKLFSVFHALNVSKPDEINLEITDADISYFENLSQKEGHYERIIRSVAPNIYGSELLKESFLLALIGSPQWDSQQRHWINVLSVGDPGTAKSKIAQWATQNLENVKLVSSKAGSAKGLFAGQKEQVDGQKVLEVGPMVSLSGRGLLCIDEFPRMSEVFDIFYSPMETGTFNSATVGGHEDLNAQTPIYATGNPHKTNLWDDDKSVVDNLQVFEPSMLSRFDLIIISKDNSTSEDRQNIARMILGENIRTVDSDSDSLSIEILQKFCKYAQTINPTLTSDVIKEIVSTFDDVMKKKQATMKNEETNTRLVGTLARITLAISRIHLHQETTVEDFHKAHTLVSTMLAQRGLQTSNANTYIERIGQKIIKILENSIGGLTDPEIHDKLFSEFSNEADSLRNDVGEGGPFRTKNKKWRSIMENVEKSYMVETETKSPRRLRYRHDKHQ